MIASTDVGGVGAGELAAGPRDGIAPTVEREGEQLPPRTSRGPLADHHRAVGQGVGSAVQGLPVGGPAEPAAGAQALRGQPQVELGGPDRPAQRGGHPVPVGQVGGVAGTRRTAGGPRPAPPRRRGRTAGSSAPGRPARPRHPRNAVRQVIHGGPRWWRTSSPSASTRQPRLPVNPPRSRTACRSPNGSTRLRRGPPADLSVCGRRGAGCGCRR